MFKTVFLITGTKYNYFCLGIKKNILKNQFFIV